MASLLTASLEQITVPLAHAAVEFTDGEDWTTFGYARLRDHARERFKRSGRWVRDLAALGRGFEAMPALEAAVSGADGHTPAGRVAALLIARTANHDSIGAWLDLARRLTVRELKEGIRRARAAGSVWPPGADDGNGSHPGGAASGTADQISRPDDDRFSSRDADPLSSPDTDQPSIRVAHQMSRPDDEDVSERLRVRMTAPPTVLAAFNEGLELYRAVEGRQAGVTSFIDALVAEACAGPSPPDTTCLPISGENREAARENALAQITRNWQALSTRDPVFFARNGRALGYWDPGLVLDDPTLATILGLAFPERPTIPAEMNRPDPSSRGDNLDGQQAGRMDEPVGPRPADECQELLRAATDRPGHGSASDPDERIRRLLALQDRLERELGRVLADMGDMGAWRCLRFAGLGHYAEQHLGMPRTTARDRACLARRLRHLPVLREAYTDGRIGFTAALTVVRILGEKEADESLQKDWVERAAGATVKRLQDEAIALGRRQVNGCFPDGREVIVTEIDGESPGRGNGCFPGDQELPSTEPGMGHHLLENGYPGPDQNRDSSGSMTARSGEVDGCFPREWEAIANEIDGESPGRGNGCFLHSKALLHSQEPAAERSMIDATERSTGTSPRLRPLSDTEWHGSLRREPGMARARVRRLGWQAAREAAQRIMVDSGPFGDGKPGPFAGTKADKVECFASEVLRSRRQNLQADAPLSLALPEELAGAFLSAVEAARRGVTEQARQELRQEADGRSAGPSIGGAQDNGESREQDPGTGMTGPDRETDDRPSLVAARMFSMRSLIIPAWVGLLALIEEFVETWDVVQNRRRPSEDAVHIRDGFRCMAPGCTSRRNLQEHHVLYRSQGGTDDLGNRLCLCAFHHQRGEHGELASCRGEAPLGIRWSLGRGGRGGSFRNEIRIRS